MEEWASTLIAADWQHPRIRLHAQTFALCPEPSDSGRRLTASEEMRSATEPEASAQIRERVISARRKQLERFASSREKLYCNAQMSSRHIRSFCNLSADCERLLERAMTQQGLSARAHDRILKVARTIADLEDAPHLAPKHIAEAIQYRSLDRTYWA